MALTVHDLRSAIEANARDPEPDRVADYYHWLRWWYRQPENQARAAEIERGYIEAMQRDPKLD